MNATVPQDVEEFSARLLDWFDCHGRHRLPWSRDRDPYRVWISEIMLQQTQVSTVIGYYERFTVRFPTIRALADARIDEILHYWTGLGYYARARNLHKAARILVNEHQGRIPKNMEELRRLPGIGRSTAGAILALAHGQRHPILDGNVKRVLARVHHINGWPGKRVVEQQLWTLAERYTPRERVADYTQAIMDLGAGICLRRNPRCGACPVAGQCVALRHGDPESYPARAPSRAKPVKATGMLLIRNERGEILLEQRPPTGIWGGLWSFPECDAELPISTGAFARLGLVLEFKTPGQAIRHSFTHFHLDIIPIPARVRAAREAIMDNGQWVWYNPEQPRKLGLAAPVKRLIETLEPNP